MASMETISKLRIELYEELQCLPEALRSEFPDLAVDFLATVFGPRAGAASTSPAKASQQSQALPQQSAGNPPAQPPAPLPQFRLHPSPCKAEGFSEPDDGCGLSEQRMAEVTAMLAAVQEEAAHIDATAGATPDGGWGDLALPVVAAPAGQLASLAVQRSAGGRRAASPSARLAAPAPAPAQLLECSRCNKVLLACSAVQHYRQCSQQPESTVVGGGAPAGEGSLSEAPSSSDGAPPERAPSGSRGSKRKRLSGAAAAAATAKASRLSRGASHQRGASAEATPSVGEVVQGMGACPPVKPWPGGATLAHPSPPPEVAALFAGQPVAASVPAGVAAAFGLQPDVAAAFGLPPVPDTAPAQPVVATAFGLAPAAAAAAAEEMEEVDAPPVRPTQPLSPTVRLSQQQRRPRSQGQPRMQRRLLTLHPTRDLPQPLLLNATSAPAASGERAARAVRAPRAAAAAPAAAGGTSALRVRVKQPPAPPQPVQQQQTQQQTQAQQTQQTQAQQTQQMQQQQPAHAPPPAGGTQQAAQPPQQAAQQVPTEHQRRIWATLTPQQQQHFRQLAAQKLAQEQQQRQAQQAGQARPAHAPAPRPGSLPAPPALSPQQLQALQAQNPSLNAQQQLFMQQQQQIFMHHQQQQRQQQQVAGIPLGGLPVGMQVLPFAHTRPPSAMPLPMPRPAAAGRPPFGSYPTQQQGQASRPMPMPRPYPAGQLAVGLPMAGGPATNAVLTDTASSGAAIPAAPAAWFAAPPAVAAVAGQPGGVQAGAPGAPQPGAQQLMPIQSFVPSS